MYTSKKKVAGALTSASSEAHTQPLDALISHNHASAFLAAFLFGAAGAFGTKTLTYLIFQRVLESQNVGLGSAGGVYAIILANIVAIFLMRVVGKSLDAKDK